MQEHNHSLTRLVGPVLAALLGFGSCHTASAGGLYRCSAGAGTYLSDRPCDGGPHGELRAFGNTQQTPTFSPGYIAPQGKAPDHLQYMSVECAQLNDAIRTGPSRGLKSGPMSELWADYRKRCGEDEAQAYKQLREAEARQRQQRRDQQVAVQNAKAREVLSAEQCYEMLRVLHGKRQRSAAMNDGERADLKLFEDNYKARCARS